MPYSHSTSLVLRDPPPVTVAFAHPAPDMPPRSVDGVLRAAARFCSAGRCPRPWPPMCVSYTCNGRSEPHSVKVHMMYGPF